MPAVSIKPKSAAKRFLSVLPERSRDILIKRFGLGEDEPMTLEAIGEEYGITRERVRQIENAALASVRKSDVFQKESQVFEELNELVAQLGGVISEEDLLEAVAKESSAQKHVVFLLVLGDPFTKYREDDHFKHRWSVDRSLHEQIADALRKLADEIEEDQLMSEIEIVEQFISLLRNIPDQYKNKDTAKRWLNISKRIASNPLGDWGRTDAPSIRLRGTRDYAYLVIRRHGNPMHFSEVSNSIQDLFGRPCHNATCHNELIKDSRFVLVGRGLYALREWGYQTGVVRDVITDLLRKYGPLSKDEIVDRVLKERYVKPNTIIVNLQNAKCFQRDDGGRYCIVE